MAKSGGSGGRAKGKPGFKNALDEFRFVQRRIAAGGLKPGERRQLEQRSERLAKQVLRVR